MVAYAYHQYRRYRVCRHCKQAVILYMDQIHIIALP
jgi:hypothetical protein